MADEFLACDLVVELRPEVQRGIASLADEPVFSTSEMLSVQARILQRFHAGRSAGVAAVPAGMVETALDAQAQLTSEQRELVRAFCTSGHYVQCAIGRAGAGKTTAMRAAVAAWTSAGYRVLGTAVKGEAARHLGKEAGIEAETLAWHLAHTDPAASPLDARTVLVVDEASTMSDRDLDRLLWLCDATGTALRLVGDPDQHGAVGAGGMFRVVCEESSEDTPELRSSHRVENPHDRAAADALRDGRVADALAELEAAGHLHVVTDEIDLYLDLLQRWWQSRQDGTEHPMVDRRNHTRRQLNRLAHRLLQITGEVGTDEIVAANDRRFSVGDQVVARKGDRTLHVASRPKDYVRNGATGWVVAIRKHRNHTRDRIRVAFTGIGTIDLPRSFFDADSRPGGRTDVGLDHAYAVTSYAVQGATFAESTSRIDEKASRSETYVDITRGRSANHLYLTRAADPLDGERLPKAPAPPVATLVTTRLAASGPERAAVDVDPAAHDTGTARAGLGLAELHRHSTASEDPLVTAATALRARQVARIGARQLDLALVAQLPHRSHVPFLARQWDDTAGDLAVYLARHNLIPRGPGRWEWALGPRSDQPDHEHERRHVAARLIDLTVATAREQFTQLGVELPDWARAHLAYHAARGTCVHDPRQLTPLYERIDTYRKEAGVEGSDGARTIEEAVFGAQPDERALRMKRRALLEEALPREPASRQPVARAGV